jgi:hypothetical protein
LSVDSLLPRVEYERGSVTRAGERPLPGPVPVFGRSEGHSVGKPNPTEPDRVVHR